MFRVTQKSYGTAAVLWVLSLQYYISQLLAASTWSNTAGYSWAHNTISDLGNTACGNYGNRLVCSPLHPVMNVSFIVLGITMASGALLFQKQVSVVPIKKIGFGALAVAGFGTIMVGLFPENSIGALHVIGAALPFTLGNIGLIVLGYAFATQSMLLRVLTMLAGLAGLIGLVGFMTNTDAGLGIGGIERVAAYPQSIWMIACGCYLLVSRRAAVT